MQALHTLGVPSSLSDSVFWLINVGTRYCFACGEHRLGLSGATSDVVITLILGLRCRE